MRILQHFSFIIYEIRFGLFTNKHTGLLRHQSSTNPSRQIARNNGRAQDPRELRLTWSTAYSKRSSHYSLTSSSFSSLSFLLASSSKYGFR